MCEMFRLSVPLPPLLEEMHPQQQRKTFVVLQALANYNRPVHDLLDIVEGWSVAARVDVLDGATPFDVDSEEDEYEGSGEEGPEGVPEDIWRLMTE